MGVIYGHTIYKEGDPLNGKIVNIGQTTDFNTRM